MKFPFLKTPVAAREVGISEHDLHALMRTGKVAYPGRDSSGDYLFGPADMKRLREFVAERKAKRAALEAKKARLATA